METIFSAETKIQKQKINDRHFLWHYSEFRYLCCSGSLATRVVCTGKRVEGQRQFGSFCAISWISLKNL